MHMLSKYIEIIIYLHLQEVIEMNHAEMERRNLWRRLPALACACVFAAAVLLVIGGGQKAKAASVQEQTFEGYITTEDDWASDLKKDDANMIHMKMMALSGLGVTFEKDGEWVFYYFDGKFATNNTAGTGGKWAFDGTDSQLAAWNLVEAQVNAGKGGDPVPVTVKGYFNGDTATNTGMDADGKVVQVLTVTAFNGAATDNKLPADSSSPDSSSAPASSQPASSVPVSSNAGSAGHTSHAASSTVSSPETGYYQPVPYPAVLLLAGAAASVAVVWGGKKKHTRQK